MVDAPHYRALPGFILQRQEINSSNVRGEPVVQGKERQVATLDASANATRSPAATRVPYSACSPVSAAVWPTTTCVALTPGPSVVVATGGPRASRSSGRRSRSAGRPAAAHGGILGWGGPKKN
eukprot:EG_transcript_34516